MEAAAAAEGEEPPRPKRPSPRRLNPSWPCITEALRGAKVDPRVSCAICSSSMSVAEIVKEVPKPSLDEMKEVNQRIGEAMNDVHEAHTLSA